MLRALLASIPLLTGVPALHAKPEDPPPTPAAEVPAPEQPALTPERLLFRVVEAYRAGPVAERVRIRVTGDSGRERTSRLDLRIDPGSDDRTRRVRLDLGRYVVFAEPGRAVVLDRYSPSLYAELPIAEGAALYEVPGLPPFALPQLRWALGGEGGSMLAPLTSAVTWEGVEHQEGAPDAWLRGDSPTGPVHLLFDAATWRLRSARVSLGQPPSPAAVRIECEPLDAGDPAAWAPSLEGLRRVDSLADLRPPPPEVGVGARLPTLGLMSSGLEFRPLRERLAPPDDLAPPTLGVLVLYRATETIAEDDARAAVTAAISVADQVARRAFREGSRSPRIIIHPVGVLELDQVTPDRVGVLSGRWETWSRGRVEALWTSTGQAMLDRFSRAASCVVLIVASDERVAAMVRADARAGEPESLELDIASATDEAIARLKLPDVPADAPPAPSR